MSPQEIAAALEDLRQRLDGVDPPLPKQQREALLEVLKYSPEIVRDYALREARRIVWAERRSTFREWQGPFVALAALVAAGAAIWDYLKEWIKWAASNM